MVTTRSKTKSASMIGVMPGTLYVKIWAFMMVGYAAQMLLIPANMVTDHWDIPSTPGMEFWIRGASVGFGCTAYLLTKVDTETYTPPPPARKPRARARNSPFADRPFSNARRAVKVATFASIAIAVLYPFNVKFGLITKDMPLKYPWHYVPEGIMATLSLLGVLAL
jgi:hypothetical protein